MAAVSYVDEQIDSIIITNPTFTEPIQQTLGTNKKNIAIGGDSLSNYNLTNIGTDNIAIGYEALKDNNSGFRNLAIGNSASSKLKPDPENPWIFPSNNTGVGHFSLGALKPLGQHGPFIGAKNTALGDSSLSYLTTGSSNTAVGTNSLWRNTSQNNNTAVGIETAMSETCGSNNTVVGAYSCKSSIGNGNSSLGTSSFTSGCGNNNTAIGFNAGSNSRNTASYTNNGNTFLGANTDLSIDNNSWSNSTAIGCGSQITDSNQIVLGTTNETVRIPKLNSIGIVQTDVNGNLSTSKTVTDDIVLSGNPTTTTQLTSDSSTKIATTAFVKNQGYLTSNDTSSIVSNKMSVLTSPPTNPVDGQFYFSPPSEGQANSAWLRVAYTQDGTKKWFSFIVGDVINV
jgi:hypothetical protein